MNWFTFATVLLTLLFAGIAFVLATKLSLRKELYNAIEARNKGLESDLKETREKHIHALRKASSLENQLWEIREITKGLRNQ